MGAGVKLLRRLADSKLVEVKKRSALTFAKPMENQTMTHQQKENNFTVFENHRKSLIQHYERSELRLHIEFIKNAKKWSILASF